MGENLALRFGAGLSAERVEDLRLVRGQANYAANAAGTFLHAAFVRSPYAHARIRSIDYAEALDMPGVCLVLSGRDLRNEGALPLSFAKVLTREDGSPMASPLRWPLAVDETHYVGDPVALVIALDRETARTAAECVAVEFDELPHVVNLDAAAAEDAPLASTELADNISGIFELGDVTAVEAAIRAAPHVTRLRLTNNRIIVNPMELRTAAVSYDNETGFTLRGGFQAPHLSQQIIADSLGVPRDRVRIIVGDMGGGFGARITPYPEDVALLLAARRLGRPVRWQCDRSEMFLSDTHARDHVTDAVLALDKDGRILAARFDVLANLGAHVSFFGGNAPTHTGNRVSTGIYDIPLIYVSVQAVLTNTVSTGPYRGAGRPEAIYRLERVLDVAAAELGIDGVEIRRRNLIPTEKMPYTAASGAIYDSGDFAALIDQALALSDPDGAIARRADAGTRQKLFGRGIACHIDTTSSLVPAETVTVRYSHNGVLEIYSGTQAMGQGLETTFAQMAATRLGLPIDAVRVLQGDTAVVATGHGSYGSRSLYLGGSALALALDKLVDEAAGALAAHLKADRRQIVQQGPTLVHQANNGAYSLAHLLSETGLAHLEASATFESVNCYPSGCHVCEVEIDPEIGHIEITQFVAVDDVGTVMHPMIVHGQIHGGVAQGISQALFEQCLYDSSGQLMSGSLMDYTLPRAADLPAFKVDFVPTFSPTNPLGAKGGGESGAIGAPAAVVNAIMNALKPYGTSHLDMPILPPDVWRALRNKMHTQYMQNADDPL